MVDAALSPDCRTVAVVTMDQEGGSLPQPGAVLPRGPEGAQSAQVSLGGITVLDLDYDDGLLWVLGEDRLMTVPQDGTAPTLFLRPLLPEGLRLKRGRLRPAAAGPLPGGFRQPGDDHRPGGAAGHAEPRGQVLDFSAAGNYCSLLTGTRLTVYTRIWSRRRPCSPPGGPKGGHRPVPTAPPCWPTPSGPGCISRADLPCPAAVLTWRSIFMSNVC
ncbi:MAG: hypothetical protein V8S34_00345 [Lawsonibacter sp.]